MRNRRWGTALLLFIIIITVLQILAVNPFWVESWYAQGIYPVWSRMLTAMMKLIPFSLFEILMAALILFILVTGIRCLVLWLRRKASFLRAAGCLLVRMAAIAAGAYLWFLLSWGLNYYRIPLIQKHGQGLPPAEEKHFIAAARWATEEIVRLYGDPRFDEVEEATGSALEGLDRVLARMGEEVCNARVRVKRFLWNYPLAASHTYGMISPFTLESHLSSSLFSVEIPFMAAHEAAHIKGYASEPDCNLLAFEACLESGHPLARFSAFFTLYGYFYPAIPREENIALRGRWPEGVKEIVLRIQERDQRYSGAFLEGVRTVYDIYLKFHSDQAGIRSYSRAGGWVAVMHYNEALAAIQGKNGNDAEAQDKAPSTEDIR